MSLIYDSGSPAEGLGAAHAVGISGGRRIAGSFTLGATTTVQSVIYTTWEVTAVYAQTQINWAIHANVGGLPDTVVASGMSVHTNLPLDPNVSRNYLKRAWKLSGGIDNDFVYKGLYKFAITPTTLGAGSYFLEISDSNDPLDTQSGIYSFTSRSWACAEVTGSNTVASYDSVNNVWVGTGSFPNAVSFQLFDTP